MSLASELVFKAVEAGAVALAARTIVPTTLAPKKKQAQGFFRRKSPEATTVSAADAVVDAFARVMGSPSDETTKRKNTSVKNSKRDSKNGGSIEVLAHSAGTVVTSVAEAARADKWIRLACCVTIDLVGSGSLAVPVFGDALDFMTAPMCALLLHQIFGSTLVTSALLAEELLPGTDAIPTATLAWLAQNSGYLAEYHPKSTSSGAGTASSGVPERAQVHKTSPSKTESHRRGSFQLW
jgi:hypothetical protein